MNREKSVRWRTSRWAGAASVLLILAVLTGCQGLSTSKPADQGPSDPLTGGLSAAPSSISFGNVQTGTSQSESDTLTNTSSSSMTITQAAVTGAGFSASGLNLPLTLAPAQAVAFSVIFNPQSAGAVSGSLALTNDGSTTALLTIALSGTAVAPGSLASNPTSLSFGSVLVGNSPTLSETLTNTGGDSLTISAAVVSGAGFSYTGLSLPLTLVPNQSTTFGVVFSPTAAGASNAILSITNSASSATLDVALSGLGVVPVVPATLAATPVSLSFPNVVVGQDQSQTETVQNTGGSTATISQIVVSGTGFSTSGVSAPVTLTPGQSASFKVHFAPQSAGSASGSVVITSDASNPNLTISLSGSGTSQSLGQLSVSPSTISVGTVTVGKRGTQTGTLNATGADVVVSSVSVDGAEFAVSGLSFPVTITAGQSANFTVTFTPQTSGVASVNASFVSNASNSPSPATFTGTGAAAPVHSVLLSWNASTSPNVVGYNIYRSNSGASGNYTLINTSLDAGTSFTDSSVVDGTTYYYETTALNSGGEESARSAPVSAAIPAP